LSDSALSDLVVRLDGLSVDFDGRFQLHEIDWQISHGEHWLLLGANGAGKSALAAVLAGYGEHISGTIDGLPPQVALVSYEAQAELIDAERRKDDADILDVISEGTPVREMVFADGYDVELAKELVEAFGLEKLLDRAFRKLSTGETRKLMIVRALSSRPDMLVLDEPFDGLDAAAQKHFAGYLERLAKEVRMVLVLNRLSEAPDFVTDVAWIDDGRLQSRVKRDDQTAWAELGQLLHLKTSDLEIPPPDSVDRLPPLDPSQPLVELKSASIRYGDTVIFENIDWRIERGEHWQLSGPNGSGKTGLLSLITGDHPQCYVNDILAFGYRRGSGESIWEIKRYIGYVSTALQWEYRVGTGLRNVVISGFHDSIGLYTKATDEQRRIADAWLELLGMSDRADTPFTQLSYGDQRLVLIARAMVKHPPLLILDEPCLGLDDMNRQLVIALIERICARSETTVLYVNHHASDRIAGIEHMLELAASPVSVS
jgi:molybdate transport system ATP-binding protein